MARLRFAGSPRRSLRMAPTTHRTARARSAPRRSALRCAPRASRSVATCRDPGHALPPARAAARCQRLDGALRPGAAALRAGRRRRSPARRGVRPRHAADPHHPRAGSAATPTRRCARPAERVVDWSGGTRLGEGCAGSTSSGACAAWPAARSSSSCPTAGTAAIRPCWPSRCSGLQRVAHRIVWVNPLKVTPGYAPLARGMAAALPYVDQFVEGHSLAAMEQLADVLDEASTSMRNGGPRCVRSSMT